jgi:hypothetical protein
MTQSTYSYAEPGAIRPVRCEPWCVDGDGHPAADFRDDQVCWGPESYVEASTDEVKVEYDRKSDTTTVWPPRIGAQAYRDFNQHPQVYVHLDLPAKGVDTSVRLTGEEARQLAAHLVEAAGCLEGPVAEVDTR